MFNSLLNAKNGATSVDSLILNVVIILGVVVAASLIVYFLWEAVAMMTKKDTKQNELNLDDNKPKKEKDDVFVSDYKLDEEAVKEETAETEKTDENVVLLDEAKIEDVNPEKAEEEKQEIEESENEEDETAKRRAYLEARRQELIRRMQSELDENNAESTEEVSEETTEETTSDENVVEEAENVEVEEQPTEEVETVETENIESEEPVEETETTEEIEEETDALEDERKALEAEKEKYALMVKELEDAKRALAEQVVEKETVAEPVETTQSVLSLDELKAKLAETEERLKVAEKEFKQCKKEYIPLRRVWDAHEKDEKKLRRKEALVAKQKVLLYGVNNYAEIDQEKATKLAEDLDLLDGLKLSVQHCEEVMKKNEERYPLLEKMYNVLKERNDELKGDIASYKEEIAKLEAEQGQPENADSTSSENE